MILLKIVILLLFSPFLVNSQTNLQIAQVVDSGFGPNVTIQLSAMQMWMDHLYNNQGVYPKVVITNNTFSNGQAGAVQNVLNLLMNSPNTLGIISGYSSTLTQTTVLSAQSKSLPSCSGSATSPTLSDRAFYANFFRYIPSDTEQGVAIVSFIKQQKWGNFAMMYTSDTYGGGLAEVVRAEAAKENIEIFTAISFTPDQTVFDTLVTELASTGSAIFVVFCYKSQFAEILKVASAQNLLDGYVWIGTDSLVLIEDDDPAAPYMQGVIITSPMEGDIHMNQTDGLGQTEQMLEFARLWVSADPNQYPGAGQPLPSFTFLYMDCAQSLYLGIRRFVEDNKLNWDEVLAGKYTSQIMGNNSAIAFNLPNVNGITGPLSLSPDGNPLEGEFQILNWRSSKSNRSSKLGKRQSNNWVKVGMYNSVTGLQVTRPILYPGASSPSTTPPSSIVVNPDCLPGSGKAVTPRGAVVCATCAAGTYNRNNNSECYPCPIGAVCNGGTDVRAGINYWIDPVVYEYPEIYDCQDNTPCCYAGNCTLTTQCPGGLSGVLCSTCPTGLYPWSNRCVKCNTGNVVGLWILIIVVVWIVVVILVALSRESNVIVSEISFFFQVAFLLADNSIQRQILGAFSGNTDSYTAGFFSCLAPVDGFGKMMLQFVYPTLMVAEFLLFWLICWTWKKYRNPTLEKIETYILPKKMRSTPLEVWFRTGAIVIMLFVFLPYVRPSLNIFNCRPVAGQIVNRFYPSVTCFQGAHIGAMVLAVFILVIMIILVPWRLRRIVRRIEKATKDGLAPEKHFDEYPGVFHLARYQRNRNWWFYAGQLVERTLLILVSVIFSFNDFAYNLAFFTAFFVGLMTLLVVWPYAFRSDNLFKALIYGCWGGLSFMRLARRSYVTSSTGGSQAINITETVFECIFLFVPLIDFIYLAWKQWGHHVKRAASTIGRGATTLARRLGTGNSKEFNNGGDTLNSTFSFNKTGTRKRNKTKDILPEIPNPEMEQFGNIDMMKEMSQVNNDLLVENGDLLVDNELKVDLPAVATTPQVSEDTMRVASMPRPEQVETLPRVQQPDTVVQVEESDGSSPTEGSTNPINPVPENNSPENTLERMWKNQSKSMVVPISKEVMGRDMEVVEPGANVEWLNSLYPGVDQFVQERKSGRTGMDKDNPSMNRPPSKDDKKKEMEKKEPEAQLGPPMTAPLSAGSLAPSENRRLSVFDRIKAKFTRSPSLSASMARASDYNMSVARSLADPVTLSTLGTPMDLTTPVTPSASSMIQTDYFQRVGVATTTDNPRDNPTLTTNQTFTSIPPLTIEKHDV